jgi:hypothetical protein
MKSLHSCLHVFVRIPCDLEVQGTHETIREEWSPEGKGVRCGEKPPEGIICRNCEEGTHRKDKRIPSCLNGPWAAVFMERMSGVYRSNWSGGRLHESAFGDPEERRRRRRPPVGNSMQAAEQGNSTIPARRMIVEDSVVIHAKETAMHISTYFDCKVGRRWASRHTIVSEFLGHVKIMKSISTNCP